MRGGGGELLMVFAPRLNEGEKEAVRPTRVVFMRAGSSSGRQTEGGKKMASAKRRRGQV